MQQRPLRGRPARRCARNGRQGRAVTRSAARLGRRRRASGGVRYVALPGGAARRRSPACAPATGACSVSPRFAGCSGSRRSRGTERRTASRPTARGSCSPRSRAARSASRRRSSSCGRTRSESSAGSSSRATGCSTQSLPTGRRSTPSSTPTCRHYSVRAIDTVSGRVSAAPIVDKREPDEEMRGSPMTRAWGPAAPGRTRSTPSRTARRSSTRSTRSAARLSASIFPGRGRGRDRQGQAAGQRRRAFARAAPARRRDARHDRSRQPRSEGACRPPARLDAGATPRPAAARSRSRSPRRPR